MNKQEGGGRLWRQEFNLVQSESALYSLEEMQAVLWVEMVLNKKPPVVSTQWGRRGTKITHYHSDCQLPQHSLIYEICIFTLVQAWPSSYLELSFKYTSGFSPTLNSFIFPSFPQAMTHQVLSKGIKLQIPNNTFWPHTYTRRVKTPHFPKSLPFTKLRDFFDIRKSNIVSTTLSSNRLLFSLFEIKDDPQLPGLISLLYSILKSKFIPVPHPYACKWEKDLEIELGLEKWAKMLETIKLMQQFYSRNQL